MITKSFYEKNKMFLFYIIMVGSLLLLMAFTWKRDVIFSDGRGYYGYLVDIFIKKEIPRFVKYPIGTPILMMPFFWIAHLITLFTTPRMANGYSKIYQILIATSGVFYWLIGNIFVYKTLISFYKRKTATFVCFSLSIGTMLPVYTVWMSSYSHIYAFAINAIFIYLVIKKELFPEKWSSCLDFLLGAVLGLVFLIRNSNIIIVFIYGLWGIGSKGYIDRLKKLFKIRRIIFNTLGFFSVIIFQMILWKLQKGSFFIFSYGNEPFMFIKNPKIYEVLFSDAKGLFIFSPVLIFAISGFFCEEEKESFSRIGSVSVISVNTLIYGMWWCWWLGNGYGMRVFCDMLPVFAISMGAFWNNLFIKRNDKFILVWKVMYVTIALVFCIVTIAFIVASYTGTIDKNLSSWYELRQALYEFITGKSLIKFFSIFL